MKRSLLFVALLALSGVVSAHAHDAGEGKQGHGEKRAVQEGRQWLYRL